MIRFNPAGVIFSLEEQAVSHDYKELDYPWKTSMPEKSVKWIRWRSL